MDKIVIIVPIYKVEPYIRRCVDSLLNQTYNNIQIILVDDGSPDNCGAICDEYAEADSRVVCLHKENGGLSSARNAGLDWFYENSDAKWISFVDSDDWVHKNYIDSLYMAAIECNTDISICGFITTDGLTPDVNMVDDTAHRINPEILWCENITNAIVSWGKLYKRHIWQNFRFPNGKIREDEFVIYKLIFKNSVSITDSQLYYYFKNSASITRQTWNPSQLSIFDAKREQISFFKDNGFNVAYEYTVINYIYRYSVAIRQIEKILPKYKNYYKQLKKEQKLIIKKYDKVVKIPYASMYAQSIEGGMDGMNILQKIRFSTLYVRQIGMKKIITKLIRSEEDC